MSYVIARTKDGNTGMLLDDFCYDAYFGDEFFRGNALDLRWSDDESDSEMPKLNKQFKEAYIAANLLSRYLNHMVTKGKKVESNEYDYSIKEFCR